MGAQCFQGLGMVGLGLWTCTLIDVMLGEDIGAIRMEGSAWELKMPHLAGFVHVYPGTARIRSVPNAEDMTPSL